jgi:hypothetical protein
MKDKSDSLTHELPELPTSQKVGRPAKYANAAERQKAYRARLKESGKRVINRVVRDVRKEAQLTSDIIDLSEVKQRR